MLRLCDKFGQKYFHCKTKTWWQKQVLKSFGKAQTNMADRVKLFMVFYLRFLSIPCIIFIAILERYGCIPLMIKTEDSSVRLTVIPTIHTVTDDLGTFILASLFIKNY